MKILFQIVLIYLSLTFISCKSDVKSIISNVESASFTIYTYDEFGLPQSTGSGFFIDESGIGLTNYHVIDGATKAFLITYDTLKFEIDEIIGADFQKDVLKFKVKNPLKYKFNFLEFENSLPEKGDRVFLISSPNGLSNSFSDGVVSAIRENRLEGKVVQFTAPMSPGSSGSAIVNQSGKVIAINKYKYVGAGIENLNFGIYLTDEIVNSINQDNFSKFNPKFSKRSKFLILNLRSDNDPFTILNAIEFDDSGTTLYMSFTNTHIMEDADHTWALMQNIGDDLGTASYLKDISTNIKYYVNGSTLGDINNPTLISLGTTHRYKQFYPSLGSVPKNISIESSDSRFPRWSNIELDKFREFRNISSDNFRYFDALGAITDGKILDAIDAFKEVIEFDPENIESYALLGVLSYSIDNKSDALEYFSKAIEINPTASVNYVNRHIIYKQLGYLNESLADISKAISLSSDQPSFYEQREDVYLLLKDTVNSMNDFFTYEAIDAKDNERIPLKVNQKNPLKFYKSLLTRRILKK
jgi:serine protease Do